MRKYLLVIFTSCIFYSTFSQNLLKNIAISDESSDVVSYFDYLPNSVIAKGDSLFFLAKENNLSSYPKLWLTNGTSAGSKKLTDLSDFYQQGENTILTTHKGCVYYTVRNYSAYTYLNSTDGNTVNKIKDLGGANSILSTHIIRDTLFFMVRTSFGTSLELWKTDGTAINTTKVTTVVTSPYYYDYVGQNAYIVVNDKLYFYLSANGSGAEPWVSDGTAAGTHILKDITAGSNGSSPRYFNQAGSQVVFIAENNKLWKSDGTATGTLPITNSIDGNTNYFAYGLISFNNEVFFNVHNGASSKLFKTNGSIITEIKTGMGDTRKIGKTNTLMFYVTINGNNYDLWKSDGTTLGTQKIKTLTTSPNYLDVRVQAGQSKCYFYVYRFINGNFESVGEHWVTDGSVSGTQKIKDLNPVITAGTGYTCLKAVGDNYYFSAYDDTNGFELWKSNGTSAGTQLVKNINQTKGSSNPQQFAGINNNIFFTANDIKYGREIWKTDDITYSTQLYADFNNGIADGTQIVYGSDVTCMVPFNNAIIVQVANTLMKIDGVNPPIIINKVNLTNPLNPEFTKYSSRLFYSGWNENYGYGLWSTDGVTVSLVKNLYTTYSSSKLARLLVSGEFLYFTSDYDTKLWKSDGTTLGTVLVKEFTSGSIQSNLTEVNGKIFFSASESSTGTEIWTTNGTLAGTTIVKDIVAGSGSCYPYNLTAFNGNLYFTASDGINYGALWKTDGTSANTIKIFSGGSSNLSVLKNKLFFVSLNTVTSNQAFWETDGSAINTKIVKDLSQNIYSISKFFNVENKYLVFDILPNSTLDELWISDGTSSETKKVKTIRNTSIGTTNSISEYFYHNKRLYFAADDGINGKELWMWDFACQDNYTITDTLRTDTTIIYNKYITGINAVRSNARVNYNANNYIDLRQGFDVPRGNVFTTSLVGCINAPAPPFTSLKNQPIYKASDLKNLGEYQPNILQFLEEPSNGELKAFYFEQKQQGKADKISWIIETEADRYSLKLLLEDKKYVGYLPKK